MKSIFMKIAMAAIASLALAGCFKDSPIQRNDGRYPDGDHGREQEKAKANERSDWSIRYVGREDYQNPDGSVEKVEHFTFTYKGSGRFIVRMVRPEDFKEVYQSDAAAFFQYEAQNLTAEDDIFASNVTNILFNRLRSGTWQAFLIEIDSKGAATLDYAETTFNIDQEAPTEAFTKWIGNWRVSNGLLGYDLTISSIDNNYLYAIDGWECGQAASFQMDQEYIEGEFWAPNGCLYIMSQYLGTYDDEDFNHGTVDELFMGNIFDSNDLTIITDEGLDLAVMVMADDNRDAAELKPMDVTIKTSGGNTYDTRFHSMQYYMWAHSDSGWYPYNDKVPELPLTMTRQPGTRAGEAAPVKERAATKASIHHGQPKAGKTGRNSVAKKAVRIR